MPAGQIKCCCTLLKMLMVSVQGKLAWYNMLQYTQNKPFWGAVHHHICSTTLTEAQMLLMQHKSPCTGQRHAAVLQALCVHNQVAMLKTTVFSLQGGRLELLET